MEIAFTGQRAIVTGACQGIGREIAKQLSKCGAKVIAISKRQDQLETLKVDDPSIDIVCVDLSNWQVTRTALENVGPVDLLVNNAGVAILEPLDDVTEDHYTQVFDINIKAVVNLTQLVCEGLKSRKAPGAIVNISSQASKVGLKDHTVYCASKGAVDAFTRAAALELGPHNIRINCVNPTVIMTSMGRLCWSDPAKANPILARIPLGRFGEVNEVVDAVLFLLSNRATMITGTCLPIDGGFLAA